MAVNWTHCLLGIALYGARVLKRTDLILSGT